MTLATFLPTTSVHHIRTVVPGERILDARSWAELESLLQNHWFASVLFDPGVDGIVETSPAINLIAKYRSIPFLAYVPLTPENLLAVAKLSTFGLADAIVHPAPAKTILTVIDRVFIHPNAQDFLGAFEGSFSKLPPCVVTAILDLFRRPHRYGSGTDIALEAGIAPKALENSLSSANLGAAKKLVILAKLLRAYGYFRDSQDQVGRACNRVGYSHRRVFAEHSRAVFGCSPSRLRSAINPDEILMSALEWFYKPSGMGIQTLQS